MMSIDIIKGLFVFYGFVIVALGVISILEEVHSFLSFLQAPFDFESKAIYKRLLIWFVCILCGYLTMVTGVIIK